MSMYRWPIGLVVRAWGALACATRRWRERGLWGAGAASRLCALNRYLTNIAHKSRKLNSLCRSVFGAKCYPLLLGAKCLYLGRLGNRGDGLLAAMSRGAWGVEAASRMPLESWEALQYTGRKGTTRERRTIYPVERAWAKNAAGNGGVARDSPLGGALALAGPPNAPGCPRMAERGRQGTLAPWGKRAAPGGAVTRFAREKKGKGVLYCLTMSTVGTRSA